LVCICALYGFPLPLFVNRYYHVTGDNSPPNKAGFYKGTFFSEKVNRDAYYVWDAAKAQGYVTGHNDGECGGGGPLDSRNKYDRYYVGAITHQYLNDHKNKRPNIDALFPPLFCQAAQKVRGHASMLRGIKAIKPTCTGYNCNIAIARQGGMIPAPACIGHRDVSQHALSGMYRFFQANRGKRRMYSTAIVAPHTYELGDIGADQTLLFVLRRFLQEYGNNTAILLWSDHGFHYGQPLKFKEGRQIHHAPFLYMTVPTQFLSRHHGITDALEHNTKQVTTHTDAYRTMLDMMGVPDLYANRNMFGQTLFQRIETERTCAEMGVVRQYCDFSVDTCTVSKADLRLVERTWKELLANATAKLGVNVCKDVLADWTWDKSTFECVAVKGTTTKALFLEGVSKSTAHSAILRVALDSAAVKVEHIARVDAFKSDKEKCLDALQDKGAEGKDAVLSDTLQRYYYTLCMC
jgi:Protein of unknown function (DUF229)